MNLKNKSCIIAMTFKFLQIYKDCKYVTYLSSGDRSSSAFRSWSLDAFLVIDKSKNDIVCLVIFRPRVVKIDVMMESVSVSSLLLLSLVLYSSSSTVPVVFAA